MSSIVAPPWRFLILVSIAAFAMNWLWEMVQMPAFVEFTGRGWQESSVPCAIAALGDVAITLTIFGIGALAAANVQWGNSGRMHVYLTAALLGCVAAVTFEWFSLATERWHYSEAMPIVPILRVGLWPLLQLPILVPLSFAVARWFLSVNVRRDAAARKGPT